MTDLPRVQVPITPSTATPQHQAAAPGRVRLAVVTISDTRTSENDSSGNYLKSEVLASGHELVEHTIVRDDAIEIRALLTRLLREADIILTSGGTGLTGRDVTIPVVESLFVKPLPGFGEVFRMLSYAQVRGAAMLSRATGGLTRGALIFAMPGSLNAVQTAWEGILKDEVGHLVFEVARHGQPKTGQIGVAPLTPSPGLVGAEAENGAATPHGDEASAAAARLTPNHVNQGAAAGIGRHAASATDAAASLPDSPFGRR